MNYNEITLAPIEKQEQKQKWEITHVGEDVENEHCILSKYSKMGN